MLSNEKQISLYILRFYGKNINEQINNTYFKMNSFQVSGTERELSGDQLYDSPSLKNQKHLIQNRYPNSFISENYRESQSRTITLLDSTIKDSVILDFWDIDDIQPITDPLENSVSQTQFTIKVVNSSFIYGSILLPFFFRSCGLILTLISFFLLFSLSLYSSSILLKIKQIAKQQFQIGTFQTMIKLLRLSQLIVVIFRGVYMANCLLYLIFLQNIFGRTMQYLFYFSFFIQDQNDNPPPMFLSIRFFTIAGSILIIVLIFSIKNEQIFNIAGRIIGVSAFIFGTYGAFIIACMKNEVGLQNYLLPPPDFSVVNMFSILPSIVLAFAFHQQFFTTSYRIEDADFKMSMASFQGSIIILTIELSIAVLGGIAYYNQFQINGSNDLITIIIESPFLPQGYKIFILIQLVMSSWLLQLQYVKQCSRQFQNIVLQLNSENLYDNSRAFNMSVGLQQLIIVVISTGIAMLNPSPFIPLVLMGALTQLFLSLLVPPILFLRYQFLRNQLKSQESILTIIVLFFTITMSFTCLFCVVIQINRLDD